MPTQVPEVHLGNDLDFTSLFDWVRTGHRGHIWACFPAGRPRCGHALERVDLAKLDRVGLALTLMDMLDDPFASRLQFSDAADPARFDLEVADRRRKPTLHDLSRPGAR